MPRFHRWIGVCAVIVACGRTDTPPVIASAVAKSAAFDVDDWKPPTDAEIPKDSLGAAILRGRAFVQHTTDSLPRYAPGRITCENCHRLAGLDDAAAPLTGSWVRYPRYLDRTGAVVSMTDRVNYCFTRSLAGRKLPSDSREMSDILAYLAFLSRGIPVGSKPRGGLAAMHDTLPGNTTRGAAVFRSTCVTCHGADGQGTPTAPALWGPGSFSIGASLAREERAAAFIWHNMPLGKPKSLTPQQAFDVAAYVVAHPRPDLPGKENDWPAGKAPNDVPYDLRSGHRGFKPPTLLPRADRDVRVPAPPRAR